MCGFVEVQCARKGRGVKRSNAALFKEGIVYRASAVARAMQLGSDGCLDLQVRYGAR